MKVIYDKILDELREADVAAMAIGVPVIGGGPNEVLYIDPSGNLASSSNFMWDDSTFTLGTGNPLNFNIGGGSFGFFDNSSLFVALGQDALNGNTASNNVVGIGTDAATSNAGYQLVALGHFAGNSNVGTWVIGIGDFAAGSNSGNGVTFLGANTGKNNTGTVVMGLGHGAVQGNSGGQVVGLGYMAACYNTAANVIAIGQSAGIGNTLPHSFIIANTELPTYTNYTAASAAISSSGVSGNTYLYHDQSTNSIGAVRL